MQKSYKSSNFLKVIDKYAKRQQSKITDEIKQHEEEELKKAESEIIEDTNNMIQKELISMKNKIAIEVSHKELSERKNLSMRRRKMMDEIFDKCREKLIEFTHDEEKYPEYLKSCAREIANVLTGDDVILFVKEEDLKYKELIEKAFGLNCSVSVDKSLLIGGIKGFSAKLGLIADETLGEKLKDHKEWAAETFGILLA